ncbi:MAG TPA: DUF445 domain-containing protein [Caulobacteraceae bacterium]|nr:DUF445 domain-containing protein [Caulobacteraceae bacterium]
MAEPDPRAADLARMRLIATGLLVLMAAAFVATSLLAGRWPWLGYLRAFAEAATVGACADWFAVTALFRHPLGLPIPHTAIIPRNKDRIGAGLGRFIADNFLTARVLESQVRRLDAAEWGATWLRAEGRAHSLARRIAPLVPELLRAIPREAREELLGSLAAAAVRAVPAGPAAARLIGLAWSDGRAQPLLDGLVERVGAYLAGHEDFIREKVSEQSFKWLPKWIDRIIAGRVTTGLINVVEEMRAPEHPWRVELAAAVESFIRRLQTDPQLQAQADEIKLRLLTHPALAEQLNETWAGVEARMTADPEGASAAIAERLEGWLVALGDWLDRDAALRARLNDGARIVALRMIAPRRAAIGEAVAGVVAGWDARDAVEKLELSVGRDLQFIRVNGTIVGGLVGLALYSASKALGWGS